MYRLWPGVLAIFFGCCSILAQEEKERIRTVEQKIAVIEDYLKSRLEKIQQQLDAQQQQIQKLRRQNVDLQKEVESLQKKLREAEGKLLKLQIEMGFSSPKSEDTDKVAPEIKDKYPGNPEVGKLAADLESADGNMRMRAVLELSRMEDPDANSALIVALQDRDPYVQMLACKVLAQKNCRAAIPGLCALLESKDVEVRRIACASLKKISGVDSTYNPEDGEEKRAQAIAEWQRKLESDK